MGIDYQIVFPTPMLLLGMHPQEDIEVALSKAYNRWSTECILPEDERLKGLAYLPFNTPEACVEEVKRYADDPNIIGFTVTLDAQPADPSQPLYAALFADRGDRQAARLALRVQLGRSVVCAAQPLHLHALALVRALQPDPHDQLDHQRAAGAVSEDQAACGSRADAPGFRS